MEHFKVENVYLIGCDPYDFVDPVSKRSVKGLTFRFLSGGKEVKMSSGKVDVRNKVSADGAPVLGTLQFSLVVVSQRYKPVLEGFEVA